jgi:hypothetical protein
MVNSRSGRRPAAPPRTGPGLGGHGLGAAAQQPAHLGDRVVGVPTWPRVSCCTRRRTWSTVGLPWSSVNLEFAQFVDQVPLATFDLAGLVVEVLRPEVLVWHVTGEHGPHDDEDLVHDRDESALGASSSGQTPASGRRLLPEDGPGCLLTWPRRRG